MATGEGKSDEEYGYDKDSDYIEPECSICEDGSKRDAYKYCVQCQDFLCRVCVKTHDRFRFATPTHHVLVGKSEFASVWKLSVSGRETSTRKCSVHCTRLVDMYCDLHGKVGCSECMEREHKSCKRLHIPDEIRKLYNSSEIQQVKSKLDTTITGLNDVVKDGQNSLDNVERLNSYLVALLKDFRREITKAIEELEKNTFAKLEEMFKETRDATAKRNEELIEGVKVLEEIKKDLENASDNKTEEYVCSKLAEDMVNTYSELFQTPLNNIINDATFCENDELLQMLLKAKALGTFTLELKSDMNSGKSERRPDQQTSVVSPRWDDSGNGAWGVVGRHYFHTTSAYDTEESEITGLCVIETDDTVLLADNKNCRLKRLSCSTLSLKGNLSLKDEPWSLCATGSHVAAVTLPRIKQVHFISVGKKMKKTRTLKIDHDCSGIAHYENVLFISDTDGNVFQYNEDGVLVEMFSYEKMGVFANICDMFISKDGGVLYVADGLTGLVATDPKSGGVLWRYRKTSVLEGACGVCVDGYRNVFVSGRDSCNVLQIDATGKKVGEVVTRREGIRLPWALGFDSTRGRMFVLQAESDKGLCFELERSKQCREQ